MESLNSRKEIEWINLKQENLFYMTRLVETKKKGYNFDWKYFQLSSLSKFLSFSLGLTVDVDIVFANYAWLFLQ